MGLLGLLHFIQVSLHASFFSLLSLSISFLGCLGYCSCSPYRYCSYLYVTSSLCDFSFLPLFLTKHSCLLHQANILYKVSDLCQSYRLFDLSQNAYFVIRIYIYIYIFMILNSQYYIWWLCEKWKKFSLKDFVILFW